ncbi:cbf7a56a-fcae-4d3e-bcd7-8c72bd33d3b7-CDS [Sclerotinia trifoliorum]|uniref:Cbf7a56a-fcae-4d3e-bcd7-8c72bd33d3b7-CDS n=1 Tax=Sclerotinia trifoliorum TaxID=28548 RepID=A0A8H2ZSG2_9HELO|nr:cbf7a56a-fcae-4d3e-bcd7-8c72bd33d3b7-CDS [Sclerotinia trifoliorum]
MRSLFSRSPDLEGGQNRTYKKGFTGDHRGRTHIPPHPSPIFPTQPQQDPFNAPPAAYRHDTIFRPPPSPSPKSVTFSDRSWSALSNAGTAGNTAGSGRIFRNVPATDRSQLDKEHLDRLHEYLGVLPGSGTPQTQREKRRFSISDPNDRPIPIPILSSSTPVPLSPHSRVKKNLKHKAAEQHFRRNNGSTACSQDRLLGELEEDQVVYQTRVFREALRTALSMRKGEEEGEFAGEVKRPVMQRRGE